MDGECDSDFVKSVRELINNGQTTEVLKLFSVNQSIVENSSWDLIPLLSEYLTTQCENTKQEIFSCSEQLINVIAEISNPEEALLQLIEEIEECEDSTKFTALLMPIRKILFRIPQKRIISLAWGFNAIQSFLDKCDIPECNNLVGKEKLLLDNDEKTLKITFLYKKVVKFYETFEVFSSEGVPDNILVLRKFLVRLLGKPLVYLDMNMLDGIKSKGRFLAEWLVQKIFQTTSDIIILLESRFDTENIDLFKLNNLGLASLFHLVYTEGIFLEKVPKVYSPIHLFQNSVYLITELVDTDHQIVIEKGLALATSLLGHVKSLKLSYLLLDSVDHRSTTLWSKCLNSTYTTGDQNCSQNCEDDIKNKILAASLKFVPELGWSKEALSRGAEVLGYPGISHGMFSRSGADLVHYFQTSSNLQLVQILKKFQEECKENPLPPGDFAEKAIQARLQMTVPYLNKWPQAIAIMSLPPNVPNALAALLAMVDDICYYAGDRSVDFNWYLRRIGIAGVYKATELYMIQDKSEEFKNTWNFLKRRLDEAVQVHHLLCKSEAPGQFAKDTVESVFVTARNILGLNWNR